MILYCRGCNEEFEVKNDDPNSEYLIDIRGHWHPRIDCDKVQD